MREIDSLNITWIILLVRNVFGRLSPKQSWDGNEYWRIEIGSTVLVFFFLVYAGKDG